MKVRLFCVVGLIASLALLLDLVPGGAGPSAAQSQPAAPVAPALLASSIAKGSEAGGPAPSPDRARATAALPSTPLMFIENVGQFPSGALLFTAVAWSGCLMAESVL